MLDGLLVLAASTVPGFFSEIVMLVVAAAVIAYICYRIGMVPIVGFLVAGILAGPNALGLVQDQTLIEAVAEFGVILLLFTIGIEFSLDKLAQSKRLVIVGGGLQVGLTLLLVTGIAYLLGLGWQTGLFTGCLIALSSTVVVMKLLADRSETSTPAGRTALGILIFQDLAVVAMVLLIPALAGTGGSVAEIGWALLKAVGIILLILLVARRIMPKLLEMVARTCSPEIFLLAVVAICFGTAYLTSLAGVSLALGAFLAGLLVSESRFSQHAFGEILPLQTLFSATFFVSIGLLLDPQFLIQNLLLVTLAVIAILLLKGIVNALVVRVLGYPTGTALYAALLLAQVGEFSLVLERNARDFSLYPAGLAGAGTQSFIAITVVLMILTPFLAQAGAWLERRYDRQDRSEVEHPPEQALSENLLPRLDNHIIIAGYGEGGKRLAQALREAAIPFLVLTLSPDGAAEAEAAEHYVLRGDYARRHTLQLAGVERAKALVVADDDPGMAHRVVSVARGMNPVLHIVARTRYNEEVPHLNAAGASRIIAEELESLTQMFVHLLQQYSVAENELKHYIERLRMNGSRKIQEGQSENSSSEQPQTITLDESALRGSACPHISMARPVSPQSDGCEECLRMGDTWVHLRLCMTCGHVGCCDSSKNKHARKHYHDTDHPIIRSFEPNETWAWCYADDRKL